MMQPRSHSKRPLSGGGRRARHGVIVAAALSATVLTSAPAWVGAQAAPAASAVPGRPLTDADVARAREEARKQLEQITDKSVEQARQRYIAPLQKGDALDKGINANRQTMPKIDALPQPQNLPQVDIGALTQQYGPRIEDLPKGLFDTKPQLFIFVTFGMPDESLKHLIAQAEPIKAKLVLRGFHNNSMQQTTRKIQELIGKHSVAFAIDPEAFDRYGVQQAPSFVLAKGSTPDTASKPCAGARCEPANNFALVSGDVSIDYALETIEKRAPAFQREARAFLKKIKG